MTTKESVTFEIPAKNNATPKERLYIRAERGILDSLTDVETNVKRLRTSFMPANKEILTQENGTIAVRINKLARNVEELQRLIKFMSEGGNYEEFKWNAELLRA